MQMQMTQGSEVSSPTLLQIFRRLLQRYREVLPVYGFYLGIFAAIYVWIVILYCAETSPWWAFSKSSFSAFGTSPYFGGNDTSPWIYNDVAMIPTGLMVMVFSTALVSHSKNKVEVMGSAFFFIGGIFLMLIGIFHGGTEPHDFVSTWFFVQAALAVFAWGIGLVLERKRYFGLGMVILAVMSVAVAQVIAHSLSVAEIEAFGIAVIDVWLVLMFFTLRRSIVRSEAKAEPD